MTICDHVIFALLGALLLYGLRNDKNEWGLGRDPWVISTTVLAAGLFWYRDPDLAWWRILGASVLTVVLWTAAHSTVLDGPGQRVSKEPDALDIALMDVFNKISGDVMGWPYWLTYMAVRYVAPCAGIAWLVMNPWFYAVGPGIVIGYWPFAYWVAGGERTKFVGAAVAGFLFYGAV